MSKLLVKFPSRNRPDKFKNILDDYTSKVSGKHEVRFVISMDSDDPTMNNDEIKNYLEGKRDEGVDLVYYYGESKTKVEACNANMDGETFDVLLLISDDMALNSDNYDEIIIIGSGKGLVSVSSVEKPFWKRKSLKNYRILSKIYQQAVTNCPRYNGWSIISTVLET